MIIKFDQHPYYSVQTFPIGGEKFTLNNKSVFTIYPDRGVNVEDWDGNVWVYKGISAFPADNNSRKKGWQQVSEMDIIGMGYKRNSKGMLE